MADLDDDLDAVPGTRDPGFPATGDPGDAMVRFIRSRPRAAPRTSGQRWLPLTAVACLAVLLVAAVAGAVVLRRDGRRAAERLRALDARLVEVESRLRDLERRSAAAAPGAARSQSVPVAHSGRAPVPRDDRAPLPTRPWVPIRWPARPLAEPKDAPRAPSAMETSPDRDATAQAGESRAAPDPGPAPAIGAGARDATEAATVTTEPSAAPGAGLREDRRLIKQDFKTAGGQARNGPGGFGRARRGAAGAD